MGHTLLPIELAEDREPWQQQPGETDEQFQRFLRYKNQGEGRTIKQAALDEQRSEGTIAQIRDTRCWTERCRAWDVKVDEAYIRKIAADRRRAQKLQYDVGTDFLTRAVLRLQDLADEDLSATDVVRLAEVGAKLQGLALGTPKQTIEINKNVRSTSTSTSTSVSMASIAHLSPEQRGEQVKVLMGELVRRLPAEGADAVLSLGAGEGVVAER